MGHAALFKHLHVFRRGCVGYDHLATQVVRHVPFDVVAVAANDRSPLIPLGEFGNDHVLLFTRGVKHADGQLGSRSGQQLGHDLECAKFANGDGNAQGKH